MRASDFITEAHHYILSTHQMGEWEVQISSHATVSIPDRSRDTDILSIANYVCTHPSGLESIRRGAGACFYDTNSRVAIWLDRSPSRPRVLTLATVFKPGFHLPKPVFEITVPDTRMPDDPKLKQVIDFMDKEVKNRGRDAVSQDLESIARFMKWQDNQISQMSRQQRRAVDRRMKKLGIEK